MELKEPELICLVPLQMLKHPRVRVSAYGMDGNKQVITSTHLHLDIEQGGYFPTPECPPYPPLAIYEQIMDDIAYIKKYSVNGGCVSPEIFPGQDTPDTYTLVIQDATGSYETANLKGRAGPPGESAYQAACEAGFTGTEEEWLQSLEGAPGAIFTPAVSPDGTLTWTNDSGLDNPGPVNIRGPQGESGESALIEVSDAEIEELWNKTI